MTAIRERIRALETHVGDDEESGLRGDVEHLKSKFEQILDRIGASEKRMAAIVGGLIVLGKIAEIFFPLHK